MLVLHEFSKNHEFVRNSVKLLKKQCFEDMTQITAQIFFSTPAKIAWSHTS